MRAFILIYAWLYILYFGYGFYHLLQKGWLDLFNLTRDLTVFLLCILCMFLYGFKKRWLPQWFWMVYFFLYLADTAYDIFFGQVNQHYAHDALFVLSTLMTLLILMPVFLTIFLTAFTKGPPPIPENGPVPPGASPPES